MNRTAPARGGAGSLPPPKPPAAKSSASSASAWRLPSSYPSSRPLTFFPRLAAAPSSSSARGRDLQTPTQNSARRREVSSSSPTSSSSSYSSSSPSGSPSSRTSSSSSPRERRGSLPPLRASSSPPRPDRMEERRPHFQSGSRTASPSNEGRKSVQFTQALSPSSSSSFPSDSGISRTQLRDTRPAGARSPSPPGPTSVYVAHPSSFKRGEAETPDFSRRGGAWRRGEERDRKLFSPRLPCRREGEPCSLDQVYVRRQRDGSMVMYLSAHLDKFLVRVFRMISYNGFLTELRWIDMCVRAKLFPKSKDPDLLKYIFRGVAKNELVIEYDQFLQLIHRLARYKFRKFKQMNDEDAVNAVLVHLFKMGNFTLENHILRDCGIQVKPETREICTGETVPSRHQGIEVKPDVKIASVQMAPDLRETGMHAEPSVQTVSVATVPTGVEAFAQTDPKKPCKDTEVQCELLKPPPKNKESATQTVDEIKGSSSVQTDAYALEDKLTETAFSWRTWPNLRKCLALEGGDESDLFKVFCCYSDYDPERMQNMMTEKACALLCKDSNMMEIPYHPEEAGVPPEQARLVYREVLVARPPTEPLYRSRRARRPLDHHRRLSSGGGGGRRDQRTPSPSAGDSAGGGATARSGGAAGSGAEAGGRGGGGGGRKEGGKCERAASTTTTAPGGGLDDDVDDDDDDGLSTVGTEGGGTEEEDNRITYVEFKAVLYYLGQLLYDTLKPRSAFLKTVRENVVLNFFKRHKNVYVAFLGSQYTGDGRGGGGRVGEESDLRTSIAAGGGGGDAIPSSSRPGRRSSPSTSSGHPAAFAGYETSLRTPQEGPPPLSSTRRCSEASTRDLLGAPTGGRGGGFDEDLDEDFASRADLGGDYPMMAMMPAPPLAPSPGAPPPPAYFYGLQPPPPPPPPMYPVSFNPAAPLPGFPLLPSQTPMY